MCPRHVYSLTNICDLLINYHHYNRYQSINRHTHTVLIISFEATTHHATQTLPFDAFRIKGTSKYPPEDSNITATSEENGKGDKGDMSTGTHQTLPTSHLPCSKTRKCRLHTMSYRDNHPVSAIRKQTAQEPPSNHLLDLHKCESVDEAESLTPVLLVSTNYRRWADSGQCPFTLMATRNALAEPLGMRW